MNKLKSNPTTDTRCMWKIICKNFCACKNYNLINYKAIHYIYLKKTSTQFYLDHSLSSPKVLHG